MPLLKLTDLMVTPPGYWRYPRPDGSFIIGGDFFDLVNRVSEFRIINQLPLGKPEEEIQDWLCRNTESPCRPAAPAKPEPGRKAKGRDVARFVKAVLLWGIAAETVSQEEADRRAEICAGCRFNVEIDDVNCFGCFGMASKIIQAIGSRSTRFSNLLKFCGVCGCSNEISCFAPMAVLNKTYANTMDFPDDTNGQGTPCWKKEMP